MILRSVRFGGLKCRSNVKAWRRKIKGHTLLEVLDAAILDAIEQVTASVAAEWFRHCGYAVHST